MNKPQKDSRLGFMIGIPNIGRYSDATYTTPDFLLDEVLRAIFRLFIWQGDGLKFAERLQHSDRPQCTAWSKAGVCIWLDALRSPVPDPGSMSTVHVVPGQICCKDRNYASVWDLSHPSKQSSVNMPTAQFSLGPRPAALQARAFTPHLKINALVTEREIERTIGLAYEVTSDYRTRYLQPGILTEELLVSTAKFPCCKAATCSDNQSMPIYSRRSGWDFNSLDCSSEQHGIHFNDGAAFLSWEVSDSISRLLAIEGSRINSWYPNCGDMNSLILVRSGQCMACLARYWKEHKDALMWEHSTYIGSKRQDNTQCGLPYYVHII